jgi:hypothetical protein
MGVDYFSSSDVLLALTVSPVERLQVKHLKVMISLVEPGQECIGYTDCKTPMTHTPGHPPPAKLQVLTVSLAAVSPCTLPLRMLFRLAESQLLLVWLVCMAKPCSSKGWQIGLRRSTSKVGAARWHMWRDSKVRKECQHKGTCLRTPHRMAGGLCNSRQST